MSSEINFDNIRGYFAGKLETYGATPRGVDWNSETSQDVRFEELSRVIDASQPYSMLDYGSGFGSMYDFLKKKGHKLSYTGYDIVENMVEKGRELHPGDPACVFTSREEELAPADYAVASGIFNIRLDCEYNAWTTYVVETITRMNDLSRKGLSFNLLTSYSDAEYMEKRPDLYYADPLFFFDYCKRHFSRNVALLHDYGVYDFTILVRKDV
jgi:SAM-dependent methyltransferase